MTTLTNTENPAGVLRLRPAAGALLGAGLALALNLAILLVANLVSDGSVQVARPGGEPEALAVAAVAAASVLPLALGALGLAVLARFLDGRRALRAWAFAVGAIAVLSIAGPATLPVAAGSIVALSVMHLATGAAAVIGQVAVARR